MNYPTYYVADENMMDAEASLVSIGFKQVGEIIAKEIVRSDSHRPGKASDKP